MAFLKMLVLLVLVTISLSEGHGRAPINLDKERVAQGEKALMSVQKEADHSMCWRAPVARLNTVCKSLSDVEQSRLAVSFANCHLQKSGKETYDCFDTMSIKECTQDMDDIAFQTYTQFFAHTGDMCYYIQSEMWQERTEDTIDRLQVTSSSTLEKVERSVEKQEQLSEKQDQTLKNQDAMIAKAEIQKAQLNEMRESLNASITSIHYLMSTMSVEYHGILTVLLLAVLCLVVTLLLPHYGRSRCYLLSLLLVEAVLEGYMAYVWLTTIHSEETAARLQLYLWVLRCSCVVVGVFLYVWEWWNHVSLETRVERLETAVKKGFVETSLLFRRSLHGTPLPSSEKQRGHQHIKPQHRRSHTGPCVYQEVFSDGEDEDEACTPSPRVTATSTPFSRDETDSNNGKGRSFLKRLFTPSPKPKYGYYHPIEGLPPPIGHPHSPYTDPQMRRYVKSLPYYDAKAKKNRPSTHLPPGSSPSSPPPPTLLHHHPSPLGTTVTTATTTTSSPSHPPPPRKHKHTHTFLPPPPQQQRSQLLRQHKHPSPVPLSPPPLSLPPPHNNQLPHTRHPRPPPPHNPPLPPRPHTHLPSSHAISSTTTSSPPSSSSDNKNNNDDKNINAYTYSPGTSSDLTTTAYYTSSEEQQQQQQTRQRHFGRAALTRSAVADFDASSMSTDDFNSSETIPSSKHHHHHLVSSTAAADANTTTSSDTSLLGPLPAFDMRRLSTKYWMAEVTSGRGEGEGEGEGEEREKEVEEVKERRGRGKGKPRGGRKGRGRRSVSRDRSTVSRESSVVQGAGAGVRARERRSRSISRDRTAVEGLTTPAHSYNLRSRSRTPMPT